MTRIASVIILVLALAMGFAACGIEFILALDPPVFLEAVEADDTFRAAIKIQYYETEFRGLEFYYRFYEDKSDVKPDMDLKSKEELDAAGFRRIMSAEFDEPAYYTPPLVVVPTASKSHYLEFTLDFGDEANAFVTAYDTEDEVTLVSDDLQRDYAAFPIRRAVSDSPDQFKTFSDLDPDDEDLASLDPDYVLAKDLILVVYALAFGKQDLVVNAYSKPTYLLYINPFDS